ncbi:MAG: glycerate kinase, partial [Pedobacter sp.]
RVPFGLIDGGKTAVIEMADASGIRLLKPEELNPLITSSTGTGELIINALDRGVNKIVIGLGGSATVDGGAGTLKALGVRFLDHEGHELSGLTESLQNLCQIDLKQLDKRVLSCRIIILCDVDNSLLGEKGSAAVFGPQKGASAEDIPVLESALKRLSDHAFEATGKRMDEVIHGGAAGGIAAALYAFLNAELVNGAEHFLKLTGFSESIKMADLLITGEGSLDEQTLQGKGPHAVAKVAKEHQIPVIGIAGKVPLDDHPEMDKYFDILMAIGNQPSDLETAMKFTASNLIRTSIIIGRFLSMSKSI